MNEKKDIFDKIMELPILNIFEPIYKKFKGLLVYLFLGFCAVVVAFIFRYLFINIFHINSYISVALAWIISTTFAFFTNRTWCFEHDDTKILQEYVKFVSGRIFTFFLEELINGVFYEFLGWNFYVVFFLSTAVTATTNYFISKLFVFKK